MTCPNCGKEMETGFLNTHHYPAWTQQEATPVFRSPRDLASLVPPDEPEEAGKGKMDALVWHRFAQTAVCRSCGLAVIPCRVVDRFEK